MIRAGDLLTFSFPDKEVRCRVELVAKDLSFFIVVERANTLRIGKECNISITKSDGVVSGAGVVVEAKVWEDEERKKSDESLGKLEYTVAITRPFKKLQKRNAFRYECYFPATVFGLNNNVMQNCHILDISAGGAKIMSKSNFEIGKIINIVTTLGEIDMHLLGVVLGSDAVDSINGYNYTLRVKFTELTRKDEETIIKFIFSEYRKTAYKRTMDKKRGLN